MMPVDDNAPCAERDLLEESALVTPTPENRSRLSAHLASCDICRAELASLQTAVGALAGWPGEELRPKPSLWSRLAQRLGDEGAPAVQEALSSPEQWPDIQWEQPAPGIYCKVLSTDPERRRVSLIVRLDPGVDYPPHTHAGIEELHLLDGELWIDDRKLYPGEYNRAEPGTRDRRVWSETGCSCVLITSFDDQLR